MKKNVTNERNKEEMEKESSSARKNRYVEAGSEVPSRMSSYTWQPGKKVTGADACESPKDFRRSGFDVDVEVVVVATGEESSTERRFGCSSGYLYSHSWRKLW